VDAFNVYYGGRDLCGRGTPGWRWLDLEALSASLIDLSLWPDAWVDRIVYCTAPRDRAGDPTSILDQHSYIAALQGGSTQATVVYGQYVPRIKAGHLVNRRGKRVPSPGATALPIWLPTQEVVGPEGTMVLNASVSTFEEKGSDVNVASHLLVDVLTGEIDAAIVYSNDSDLCVPLQQARLRVPIGTVNPGTKPTTAALQGLPNDGVGRHWWRRLQAGDFTGNQLPEVVQDASRPVGW
jgi:hypothetical protein